MREGCYKGQGSGGANEVTRGVRDTLSLRLQNLL